MSALEPVTMSIGLGRTLPTEFEAQSDYHRGDSGGDVENGGHDG